LLMMTSAVLAQTPAPATKPSTVTVKAATQSPTKAQPNAPKVNAMPAQKAARVSVQPMPAKASVAPGKAISVAPAKAVAVTASPMQPQASTFKPVASKPVAVTAKPGVAPAKIAVVAAKPAPAVLGKAPAKEAPKVAVKVPVKETPKTAVKVPLKQAPKQAEVKGAAKPQTTVAVQDSKANETDKKHEPKAINAVGRRDPFISPVVNLGAVGSGCSSGKRCLAIDQIALKGVVRSDVGMIAVVVNAMDKAYFLRENDPVFNGYVVKITGDSIVFKETFHDRLGKSLTRDVTKTITRPAV